MKYPTGYQSYKSIPRSSGAVRSCSQIAYQLAGDSAYIIGTRVCQVIVFEIDGRSIALATSVFDADHTPSNGRWITRDRILRSELRRFKLRIGKEFIRSIGRVGATRVARIGHVVTEGPHEYVRLIYVAHGRKNERYLFTGICEVHERSLLVTDMNLLATSLTAGMPKPPRFSLFADTGAAPNWCPERKQT